MRKVLIYILLALLFPINQIFAQSVPSIDNTWHPYNSSDTVFIFVHGIFSDSVACWTADNGTYWPDLISQDNRFGKPSIFLGGYSTNFNSGIYRINDAASELLSYLRVPNPTAEPAPLSKANIIFIAHSTGGLVVRYMLERYQSSFIDKNIGLVLLASPSRGSDWSNRLKWIREFYGNQMAGELDRDNDFVQDLDSRFADFIQQKRLPNLTGIDAFENKFIIPGFFFNTEYVVNAEDSASYFGAYRIIPDTDHFSIAKPTSQYHPSHQVLYEFYDTRFKPILAASKSPIVHSSPSEFLRVETMHLDQPIVNQASHEYTNITFHTGDIIEINAGGCVQTGGHGSTWKRYVDPNPPNKYFGTLTIPNAVSVMPISTMLGKKFTMPPSSDGQHLILGYIDDNYTDNGYLDHDDGTDNQCAGIGPAYVDLTITHH